MPTAVRITNLTKSFGKGPAATRAVDSLSLTINPGELFFLLGPSGCGKTTLLRMIAGFIEPTEGTIEFSSGPNPSGPAFQDVTHTPPNKRNTGMVFQSYALWPHMSVEANVAFGLGVRKVPKPDRARRVAEALDAVHMAQYAKRRPNQLSGGQQQRVALARALVIRPDVLLLDEPLSNLDAKLRADLRLEIRRICKASGLTGIYVTHDQKEALSMADRVALLRDGRIVQLGTPRQLYARPNSRFVAEFLGDTNLLPATIHALHAPTDATLSTPAGTIRTTALPEAHTLTPGSRVLVSLRPEALRLTEPGTPNALRGRHAFTTDLGETAQHHITLPDASTLRVAELNPFGHSASASLLTAARELHADLGLTADPHDVVVLPDPPP
jgi:iron(III) transport system ATP-binding protein